jgi:hypothetical protein
MKRKRIPPHLSLEERDEFLKLQTKWDAKLRDDGFKDIEDGWDTNEYSSSTLRGGDPARQGVTFVPLEPEDDDQPHTNVTNEPAAQYWRLFASAAHDLPEKYPRRALILAVAEAGIVRHALVKRHHLTFRQAMLTIEKFCRKAGISAPQFRASPTEREKEPEPAPVRRFSRAEAKLIGATPPKQIPDKEVDEKWKKKHPPVARKKKAAA